MAARLVSRKVAGEVGVDDRGPVVLAHPQQERVLGDARVGDEHLDGAVGLLDLGEGRLDRVRVGDVAAHVECAVGRAAVAGGDGDLVALGQEGLGDGAADAAVAAGDQD